MEDDRKVFKVEYLRNQVLDYTQILNLRIYDQTLYKSSKWRQPPMEDKLQWKTTSNGRWPQREDDRQ